MKININRRTYTIVIFSIIASLVIFSSGCQFSGSSGKNNQHSILQESRSEETSINVSDEPTEFHRFGYTTTSGSVIVFPGHLYDQFYSYYVVEIIQQNSTSYWVKWENGRTAKINKLFVELFDEGKQPSTDSTIYKWIVPPDESIENSKNDNE